MSQSLNCLDYVDAVPKISSGETLNIVNLSIPGDSKFTLAKAGQLPSFLESEKRRLQQEKKLLKDDKLAKEKQLWQYSQVSNSSITGTS
jgi:hypothetical protein